MESNQILVIAQYIPPAGGVGTFRVTKFVKYLGKFGWKPSVVTLDREYYPDNIPIDSSLEGDIPEAVQVYRTKSLNLKFLPDAGLRWFPCMIWEILNLNSIKKFQVMFITGGPFFPLIAGPIIKLLRRLPYVVDLRDPWRLVERDPNSITFHSRVSILMGNILEPIVIRYASKVICVSDTMCDNYRRIYKKHDPAKFVVISNGYDSEDYKVINAKPFDKYTIVYSGKFHTREGLRDYRPFLCAIKLILDQGRELQFVHIGRIEKDIVAFVEELELTGNVGYMGFRSYHETLAITKCADLLLLIAGEGSPEPTQKVFDYIGCRKEILALAPTDGEIARVLSDVPVARLIENGEHQLIADVIINIMDEKAEIYANYEQDIKYGRELLTKELSVILNEIEFNQVAK